MEYEIKCNGDHVLSLTATDLQYFLEEGNLSCQECSESLEIDGEISIHCQACDYNEEIIDLESALYRINDLCPHCEEYTADCKLRIPGSHTQNIDSYEFSKESQTTEDLARQGRTDYWEGLIHFCNEEEFLMISHEMRIRASPTGLFSLPAVCLTETPFDECEELKARHGKYGFVFKKKDLMKIGGNPAIYVGQSLIRAQKSHGGFAKEVKPYVTALRIPSLTPHMKKHDYLFEREWRVPVDIDLSAIMPFGIILPFYGRRSFSGDNGELILAATQRFKELYQPPSKVLSR